MSEREVFPVEENVGTKDFEMSLVSGSSRNYGEIKRRWAAFLLLEYNVISRDTIPLPMADLRKDDRCSNNACCREFFVTQIVLSDY